MDKINNLSMKNIYKVTLVILSLASALAQECSDSGPLLDQAYVRFIYNKTNSPGGPANVIINYTLSPCFDCLTQNAANASSTDLNVPYFIFSTQWTGTFFIYNESDWADPDYNVPYVGSYEYYIQQNAKVTFMITDQYSADNKWQGVNVDFIIDEAGDDIWIPVYIAISVFISIAILYNAAVYLIQRYRKNKVDESSYLLDQSSENFNINRSSDSRIEKTAKAAQAPKGKDMSQRVQSLDTFRGMTLSIMIFVNAGGGEYVQLDHAPWNGLQLADLLFPWFIWMMGFSMSISYESQKRRGASKRDMMEKVLMRTFKLAFLGLMSSNFGKPLNDLRIPGVLMRFAVSYFFVSLIIIFTPRNEDSEILKNSDKYKVLVLHKYEYIVVLLIISLWLGLTFGLPVPGCPTGYIGPGGLLGSFGKHPDCTGGAAGYIDKTILGISHMYGEPTCQPIYLTGSYDPEGILGCLTSITMVFFGLTAGRVMMYHKEHKDRLQRWLIGAVFFGIVTLILTGASQNDGIIPVNKNMWSLSFICCQCCTGLLMLSTLYVVVDIKKYWGGGPFKAMGMNSITMFCGSVFLSVFFPLSFQLSTVNGCPNPDNNTHGFNLVLDLWNTIFFLLLANWMDYEKFYINL